MNSNMFMVKMNYSVTHANPIGQSGVEFTIRISVREKYFEIQFNDGNDFITYNYIAPPWMVNWIMVKGNVKNVKFANDAQRCRNKDAKPFPNHITKIETTRPLKDGQYIIVAPPQMIETQTIDTQTIEALVIELP
uniref:Galectin n=1 Tax=Meloidogyne hapla TaxID=6305 RepID=A0A1I8B8Z3_MELHA